MYRDVYGIRFDAPPGGATDRMPWQDVWAARTQAQWQALAKEYAFAYVIGPAPLALDLPVAFRHGGDTLYRIPGSRRPFRTPGL